MPWRDGISVRTMVDQLVLACALRGLGLAMGVRARARGLNLSSHPMSECPCRSAVKGGARVGSSFLRENDRWFWQEQFACPRSAAGPSAECSPSSCTSVPSTPLTTDRVPFERRLGIARWRSSVSHMQLNCGELELVRQTLIAERT